MLASTLLLKTKMSAVVNWNNLPSIVLLEIFKRLSYSDRINASSTCKEWRKALYFPNFWREVTYFFSSDEQNSIDKAQFFTRSFITALRNVTLVFSYKENYLEQVSDILQKLSENSLVEKVFIYGRGEHVCNNELRCCASHLLHCLQNSKNLKLLCINSCCWFLLVGDSTFMKALEKHSDSITHLGFGFNGRYSSKENIINFSAFEYLKVLKLHAYWLTDRTLNVLSDNNKNLHRLILEIDSVNTVNDIQPQTWQHFHQRHPECELRVNLIQCIGQRSMDIFNKFMPITHIKLLFCQEINLPSLTIFTSYTDLKSIWCVVEEDNFDIRYPRENPFVLCAWTCHKLVELVLIGHKLDNNDLVGIARLRGTRLQRLDISTRDLIKFFDTKDSQLWKHRGLFNSELMNLKVKMSKALKRPWSPIDKTPFEHPNSARQEDNKAKFLYDILSRDMIDETD